MDSKGKASPAAEMDSGRESRGQASESASAGTMNTNNNNSNSNTANNNNNNSSNNGAGGSANSNSNNNTAVGVSAAGNGNIHAAGGGHHCGRAPHLEADSAVDPSLDFFDTLLNRESADFGPIGGPASSAAAALGRAQGGGGGGGGSPASGVGGPLSRARSSGRSPPIQFGGPSPALAGYGGRSPPLSADVMGGGGASIEAQSEACLNQLIRLLLCSKGAAADHSGSNNNSNNNSNGGVEFVTRQEGLQLVQEYIESMKRKSARGNDVFPVSAGTVGGSSTRVSPRSGSERLRPTSPGAVSGTNASNVNTNGNLNAPFGYGGYGYYPSGNNRCPTVSTDVIDSLRRGSYSNNNNNNSGSNGGHHSSPTTNGLHPRPANPCEGHKRGYNISPGSAPPQAQPHRHRYVLSATGLPPNGGGAYAGNAYADPLLPAYSVPRAVPKPHSAKPLARPAVTRSNGGNTNGSGALNSGGSVLSKASRNATSNPSSNNNNNNNNSNSGGGGGTRRKVPSTSITRSDRSAFSECSAADTRSTNTLTTTTTTNQTNTTSGSNNNNNLNSTANNSVTIAASSSGGGGSDGAVAAAAGGPGAPSNDHTGAGGGGMYRSEEGRMRVSSRRSATMLSISNASDYSLFKPFK